MQTALSSASNNTARQMVCLTNPRLVAHAAQVEATILAADLRVSKQILIGSNAQVLLLPVMLTLTAGSGVKLLAALMSSLRELLMSAAPRCRVASVRSISAVAASCARKPDSPSRVCCDDC